ncbi:MAG: hypothetical protein J3Q66DRAFT_393183 [Benniella sp.]|nr:MAG: hypothetical protein J3Q66DRAFT_393183 [Benniella sp.]
MFDILGLGTIVARLRRLQYSQLLVTVFDLPELNDIIFSHLSRNDLVRWARVSKRWHHAVIYYIWRDMSTLTEAQYKALTTMVINDYQMMTEGRRPSILPKYCPLIRKFTLLSEQGFAHASFLSRFSLQDVLKEKPLSDARQSTAQSIFHHFMVHCTHLHTLDFETQYFTFFEPIKVIADSAAQHLRHLSIRGSIPNHEFKYIMARCPVTLEILELRFQNISRESQPPPSSPPPPAMTETDLAGQEPLPNLRRLAVRYRDNSFHQSLSSLWKRCKFVEALELTICHGIHVEPLVTNMVTFLPNLNSISLVEDEETYILKDEEFAQLLSASRVGWKSVSNMQVVGYGKKSWEALFQHTSTLEHFGMARWERQQADAELEPFLSLFPRLQSFVTLSEGGVHKMRLVSIDASTWIHEDRISGSLTPWLCEHLLTDLRIMISGIPRPDVTQYYQGKKRQSVVVEFYPGEGRKVQQRVYERLSRFINLEVLWLGSNSYHPNDTYSFDHSENHQYECLEMSLESGMDQLEGLKRLQVLNISLMATRMGRKEAQWMAEQWPKLREIRGLDDRVSPWSARQWLNKNCPRIATP